EEQLGYPVIVKPARLGSSIGIAKADDRAELDHAIEDAFRYDEKVVVEQAVQNLREINCSVLGDPQEAIASVLEQPIPTDTEEVLSFTDKYQRGGSGSKARGLKQGQGGDRGMASLDRLIPAPLSDEQTGYIRDLGVRIFQTFECAGVARIDFMIDDGTGQVYFNEINTIPGSFSFYLWEPTGIPFAELTHRLVQTALRRHEAKNGRVRTYDTNLLSERSLGGLKGKG
ncbi:MAG: D-alanine--D-alanine ligase, partial [Bacteroidota bacterium]